MNYIAIRTAQGKKGRSMADSEIKAPILQAAIHLFGNFGFEGVTTRAIAQKAHCMEGGIYRLYGSKSLLYRDALTAVVQASVSSMAALALELFREEGTQTKWNAIIATVVHRWYSSFSQDGAKILQQVLLADKPRQEQAQEPFACVLAILQKTLGPELKSIPRKFDLKLRTQALIWTLFQHKLSYSGPVDKEELEVDRYLA